MKMLLIFLLFPIVGLAQADFVKITLLDGKVELLAPKQLTSMTDDMWIFKYHQKVKPLLVLTDSNAEINLIAQMTGQALEEGEMEKYKDFRIANLEKTRSDLKILSDGVKTVNGKNVGYCKFLTQAIDQPVFNYYFFIIVNGKILFCSFNCIEKLQGTWEKYADEIVDSIKVK